MDEFRILVDRYHDCIYDLINSVAADDENVLMYQLDQLLDIARTIYSEAIIEKNKHYIVPAGIMLKNTTSLVVNIGEVMMTLQFDMAKVKNEVLPALSSLRGTRFYN